MSENVDMILDTLYEAADDIREDYSGRGMYGEQCIGFVVDVGESLVNAVAQIMLAAADHSQTCVHEMAKAFRTAKTDNMGLGTIVYFPKISAVRA